MLSEVSQTEKVKNHIISFICEIQNWSQHKNKQEKQTKQKLIDIDNSMVVTRGEGAGG